MHVECPTCLRCCFCFPLRYGLIAWGYFKLAIAIVFSILLARYLYTLRSEFVDLDRITNENILVIMVFMIFVIAVLDIVFIVIFIVGAHKKKVNLLQIYYFYGIALCIILASFGAFCIGLVIFIFISLSFFILIPYVISELMILFVYLITQIYILLLVRSEMVKLKNSRQFRFVNNAAEHESILNIRDTYEKNAEESTFREENEVEGLDRTESTVSCKVIIDKD